MTTLNFDSQLAAREMHTKLSAASAVLVASQVNQAEQTFELDFELDFQGALTDCIAVRGACRFILDNIENKDEATRTVFADLKHRADKLQKAFWTRFTLNAVNIERSNGSTVKAVFTDKTVQTAPPKTYAKRKSGSHVVLTSKQQAEVKTYVQENHNRETPTEMIETLVKLYGMGRSTAGKWVYGILNHGQRHR